MDVISLTGIQVYAYHGVLPAERELGQRFVIDAHLHGDFSAAALSDDLALALDYTAVHRLISETVGGNSCMLIEALAGRLCTVLLQQLDLERVVLTVHKPNPPIPHFQGSAAVTLTRDRSWLDRQDDVRQGVRPNVRPNVRQNVRKDDRV